MCNIESFIDVCFELKVVVLRHPFHYARRFLGENNTCVVLFENNCQKISKLTTRLTMEISDTELKKRLEAHNVEVPPITYTTRDLLVKKLLKLDSGEKVSGRDQSKKNGRTILQSEPSVTFNPDDETIEGYDVEDGPCEEDFFEEKQVLHEPVNTSTYQDLIAEKTRYRKSKSPEARFRNKGSTPNVNKTSNYVSDEDYPREIYTVDRNSSTNTSIHRNVSSRIIENEELLTKSHGGKQSSSSCFQVIFKIIVSLVIAFFFVVLYEYLTRENKPQLLS